MSERTGTAQSSTTSPPASKTEPASTVGYFKVDRDGNIIERSDKPLKFTAAEEKANAEGRKPNSFIIVKVDNGVRSIRATIREALDKVGA